MIDLDTPGRQPVPTADDMRELGQQIGAQLTAGTVVVLTGPLGAGKTTLTQGIAQGLGVKGRVQSPTFTIVRTHKPGAAGAPGMLHMDAYRLLGQDVQDGIEPGLHIDRNTVLDAMESLDIDASIDEDVVIAEWGRGVVELLSDRVLDIEIFRDENGGETGDATGDASGEEADGGWAAENRTVHWRWLT